MTRFVNREEELDRLEKRYDSDSAEFIILYGRRRLGKSELVHESIRERDNAIYYQAIESTAQNQLEQFIDIASETHPVVEETRQDWEYVIGALGKQNAIIVIDEFPFLIEENRSIPSRFQQLWDTRLSDTAATLILIGSSISVMKEKVLSGGSPLYGRRTATIDLNPLSLGDARQFYPSADPETALRTWAVFGGTPYYLQTIDPEASLGTNIQQNILSERGLLYNEPEFLIRTEFREPNTYFSLLQAMARGKRRPNEIAQTAGVDSQNTSTYLQKLRRLRLIERHIPVTESPTSSKRGRYRLSDPLFRFWFRFVYGNQDRLLLKGEDAYESIVKPEFADYASPIFEILCQKALPALIPRTYEKLGQWWFKEHELDVLGLSQEGLIAGECKFTASPVSEGVLAQLERTTRQVRWNGSGSESEPHFALFSRSGFTDDLKNVAEKRADVSLFDITDVVDALQTTG
jgi:AAA+ ATPase superfamily predicted ATPase